MSGTTWRFTDEQGVERNVTTPELRSALVAGTVQPSTLVWREGMKEWVPAFTLPELATAAISAARREVPHTPTLRPESVAMPAPPPRPPTRNRPTQTLVGIESPLAGMELPSPGGRPPPPRPAAGTQTLKGPGFADEVAAAMSAGTAALEDTESAPHGIPLAPRMPTAVDPGSAPSAPLRASAAVSAAAASLGPASTRTKSMPPPLPPRGPKTPILGAPAATQPGVPKRTLVGVPIQANLKPPPPPRRSTTPPPMPARAPSTPPPAKVEAIRPVSTPPPPLKRQQVATPQAATPTSVAAATATPPVASPTGPTPAASSSPNAPSTAISAASTTTQLPVVADPSPSPAPPPVAAAPAPQATSNPDKAEATDVLAMPEGALVRPAEELNDDWTEESTKQFARAQAQAPAPAAKKSTPDAAPTLKKTPAPSATAARADATNGAGKAQPHGAAPSAPAATTQVSPQAATPPAAPQASRAPLPPASPEVSPPSEAAARRTRTIEMNAVDHHEAAVSSPVPVLPPSAEQPVSHRSAPQTSEPLPFMMTAVPPSAERPPMPSSPPPADRSSRHSLTNELDEELRRREAVEVPRRSIVGASLLWMIGLMTFFFVGRCAGKKASQLAPMRDGAARYGLAWQTPGPNVASPQSTNASSTSSSSEPKPCWVSRQPTKWAARASKSVPIDMQPIDGSMWLGYAADDHEGVGIVVDPKTGKFEEKFREKSDKKDKDIAWVAPVIGSQNGFVLQEKSDKEVVPAGGKNPFYVVFDKENAGFADAPDHEAKSIFKLAGEGDVASEQVLETPPVGSFLSFRRGNAVYGGFFGGDKAPIGDLAAIPASGSEAKVGKPRNATNGIETAVVFADLATGKGDDWQVRLAHAKVGKVPDASDFLSLPEGGPGGRKIAPDIVGLADGRWLVMWTEGPPGGSAIRALAFTSDFQPIGDPIALSPPAGNFGQAVLGSVGDYTTVVFLQAGDEAFELWGAVLRCG